MEDWGQRSKMNFEVQNINSKSSNNDKIVGIGIRWSKTFEGEVAYLLGVRMASPSLHNCQVRM